MSPGSALPRLDVGPVTIRAAVVEDHPLQRERTVSMLQDDLAIAVLTSHVSLPEFASWLRMQPAQSRPTSSSSTWPSTAGRTPIRVTSRTYCGPD